MAPGTWLKQKKKKIEGKGNTERMQILLGKREMSGG